MADNYLYFTELLSMPVLDLKGRRIGRVKDAALVPREHAARIDRFLVGGGDTWLTLRYDQVRSITLDPGIQLTDEQLLPYHDDEYMLRIGRDLLDQQIIDVTGRKVVRVNDVTMDHPARRPARHPHRDGGGYRHPQHVPAPVPGRAVPRRWVRRLQQAIPPNSIRWDFANVVEPDPLRRLRLNISYDKLEAHAPRRPRRYRRRSGPRRTRSHLRRHRQRSGRRRPLRNRDPKMQASILESLEPEKAADIVEEMAPDEAADVLSEMEEETSEEILDEMDSEPKTGVRELLEFEEDTAGGLMNTEYVVLHENATVADAMAALKGNEDLLETLNTLFLIDEEGRLTAAIPLARLFLAQGESG